MITEGNSFKYYFNNELKTKEEIEKLIDYDTTVSIKEFDVLYSSPKKIDKQREVSIPSDAKNLEVFSIKETDSSPTGKEAYIGYKSNNGNFNFVSVPFTEPQDKIQELLKEADKHQAKNGGILKGLEFPFDYQGTIGIEEITKIMTNKREQKVIEDWNKKVDIMSGDCDRLSDFTIGKKETEGKLDYELGWDKEEWSQKDFLKSIPESQKLPGGYIKGKIFKYEPNIIGVKETENKVDYGELDWNYIDGIALRMTKNLAKYPPKNWHKKIEIEELAKSAIRHARKILQSIENDEESVEDHAIALGANGMMINYQIKLQKDLVVSK